MLRFWLASPAMPLFAFLALTLGASVGISHLI